MNKIFVLLCVLLSFSCSESFKLTNICEADHFDYNGVLVNSVYCNPAHINMRNANEAYLMDLYENCGVQDESNETAKEFYKIRRLVSEL